MQNQAIETQVLDFDQSVQLIGECEGGNYFVNTQHCGSFIISTCQHPELGNITIAQNTFDGHSIVIKTTLSLTDLKD